MFNFRFRLLQLTGGGLEGPFLLVVFIKIADGVFLGGQGRIQRDRDFRIIVIIQTAETFFPFLDPISIGIQQLAVDPEFFPFFRTEDRTHNGLFFWSGVGVSFGFILFTLLFLLFRNPVMEYYSQESPLLSQYYLLLIPMGFTTLFYNFFTSWLQAFHKNVISSFSNEIVLRLLVTIEISLYVFKVLTFEQFVIGYVLIYFVPTVILLIYTLRLHYTRYKPCFSRRVKKLASIASVYGFWQYLGGTSNYIVPTVDQAMLAGMWGLAENGIYGIMLCLVSVMQMPYRSLVKVSLVT